MPAAVVDLINRRDFVQHPDQHQPNGLILRQSVRVRWEPAPEPTGVIDEE
jgi:hypothetical protein